MQKGTVCGADHSVYKLFFFFSLDFFLCFCFVSDWTLISIKGLAGLFLVCNKQRYLPANDWNYNILQYRAPVTLFYIYKADIELNWFSALNIVSIAFLKLEALVR